MAVLCSSLKIRFTCIALRIIKLPVSGCDESLCKKKKKKVCSGNVLFRYRSWKTWLEILVIIVSAKFWNPIFSPAVKNSADITLCVDCLDRNNDARNSGRTCVHEICSYEYTSMDTWILLVTWNFGPNFFFCYVLNKWSVPWVFLQVKIFPRPDKCHFYKFVTTLQLHSRVNSIVLRDGSGIWTT